MNVDMDMDNLTWMWIRVFNFRYFFNFAKHETIRKPRLFRENFACFAKQKYAKFRFVSFRTTKIKRNFASFRKNLVLFREILFCFVLKEKFFAAILEKAEVGIPLMSSAYR
jgi:hypothetical protein